MSLVLTAAKVVYVNGKTIHVREGDKAVMLYNTKLSFPVNTILSGMLKCDFEYYHGIPEVKDNANTNQDDLMAIPAGDATLSPIEATIDEINAKKYLCDLVKLSDVKITSETADGRTSYYAVSGEKKVVLFKNEDKYKQLANNGKTYTIVALFNAIFKNTSELQPVEITETTTGIESIESDTLDTQAPLFNTAGQRVDKDYKGVVIQNGKKYINR